MADLSKMTDDELVTALLGDQGGVTSEKPREEFNVSGSIAGRQERMKQAMPTGMGGLSHLAALPGTLGDRGIAAAESFRPSTMSLTNNPLVQLPWQALQAVGDVSQAAIGRPVEAAVAGVAGEGALATGAGMAADIAASGGAGLAKMARKVAPNAMESVAKAIPTVLNRVLPESLAGRWFGRNADEVISKYIPVSSDPTGEVIGRAFLSENNQAYKVAERMRNDLYDKVAEAAPGQWMVNTSKVMKEAMSVLAAGGNAGEMGGKSSKVAQELIAKMSTSAGVERIPSMVDVHGNPLWGIVAEVADNPRMSLTGVLEHIKTLGGMADKATSQKSRMQILNLKTSMEDTLKELAQTKPQISGVIKAMDAARKFSHDVFYPMYGLDSQARKLTKKDASTIVDELFFKSKTPEQINQVRQSLRFGVAGPEVWKGLGDAGLERMVQKASPMSGGGKIDFKNLVSQWDGMPEQTRKLMAGENFDNLQRVMGAIGKNLGAGEGVVVKGGTDKYVIAGGVMGTMATGSLAPFLTSIAVSYGTNAVAKFLNNRKALYLMSEGLKTNPKSDKAFRIAGGLNQALHDVILESDRHGAESELQEQIDLQRAKERASQSQGKRPQQQQPQQQSQQVPQ